MESNRYAELEPLQTTTLVRNGVLRFPAVFIQTNDADAEKINQLLKRCGVSEAVWSGVPTPSSPAPSSSSDSSA